jgi:hypothetical protein
MAGAGAGMVGIAAARVKSWARLRRQQFDSVVDRLIAAMERSK